MANRRSWLSASLLVANGALLAVVAILLGSRVFSSTTQIRSTGPTIEQVQELADLV